MKIRTPLSAVPTTKRGCLIGIGLAAAVFLICCIWYSWVDGLVFAAMFLAAGLLKLEPKHSLSAFVLNAFWGVVCIFISCLLPTKMISDANYLDIGAYRVLMNFLCAAAVYGVGLVITGEIKSAVVLASLPLLILSTANGFVYQFRGNLLKPLDILSAGTAMNVVGQYRFTIQKGMAYSWILWLWMVFSLRALPRADRLMPKRWLRLAALAATLACTGVFLYGSRIITMKNWDDEGATRNGYLLNFAVGLRDCFLEEPENYSEETLAELEQIYCWDTPAPEEQKKPNIIVIMSESYADFEVLGSELRTNVPVTPFLDSLEENTIRGYALASIFGGTTANSEFEFLTGFTMANVPNGSCPYQQYINTPTFSLAHVMQSYGYQTFATHPYYASGWNRTAVYPCLGFEKMTFDEDYPYQDLVRKFVSDREMYGYLLNALDGAGEAPLFLFGITMQNHGDYSYSDENYEQTIFLEGYETEYPMAEQYLTLLHETDQATGEFLTALEEYPEDTIVLFFGDHFPQVEGNFFPEVHGGEFETLSEQMLKYTIPFFIWANFDIPEQTVECTSLNYLARYLLEAAGLELPPYYRFLAELEKNIPSLNADGYYSLSQQSYLPFDKAEGEEAAWLNQYEILQYNGLFDQKNSSQVFFGQYLS